MLGNAFVCGQLLLFAIFQQQRPKSLSCSRLALPNKLLFGYGHLRPVALHLDGDCQDQSRSTDVLLHRYQGQRQSHAAILTRFEADLQDISGIALHPVARTDKLKRLSDLVPVTKLRKWAAHCQEGHDKFVVKVPPSLVSG